MAKKTKKKGYGKLLDAWTAPVGSGDPIGCVATSFTFSPAFFEEECLTRFLKLETHPGEDGPLYLVEREEKLSQVICAAAVVDQHHCKGTRSLRWDMIPARMPGGGVLHAKISLLCWLHCVRLVVASANITEDGYRRNQEIFGVLDYTPGSDSPRSCLHAFLNYLDTMAGYCLDGATEERSPARKRIAACLDHVRSVTRTWGAGQAQEEGEKVRVVPVVTGPAMPSLFTAIQELWPGKALPARADIVSPFFDLSPENRPAAELWKLMRPDVAAGLVFYVSAEEVPGSGELFLHAPKSLQEAQPPDNRKAYTVFNQAALDPGRPLHAKALCLEDSQWAVYVIGSSNFTSAGTGLAAHPNFEANLAYIVNKRKYTEIYESMLEGFIPFHEIDASLKVIWKPLADETDTDEVSTSVLPAAFGSAVYDSYQQTMQTVRLHFTGHPPKGWRLLTENESLLYDEERWLTEGTPAQVTLMWHEKRPPSGFIVTWRNMPAPAWWPVNISGASALPPPEELKDLPLEVLISILSTARPLYRVLSAYLKKKRIDRENGNEGIIDPLLKVDTSRFLLQRTRRISSALYALRDRIERPAVSEDCLHWRLRGPVGVLALADALVKEGKSAEERAFLLAELALELSRVTPQKAAGCLPPHRVRQEVQRVITELKDKVAFSEIGKIENLKHYIANVFNEAG